MLDIFIYDSIIIKNFKLVYFLYLCFVFYIDDDIVFVFKFFVSSSL